MDDTLDNEAMSRGWKRGGDGMEWYRVYTQSMSELDGNGIQRTSMFCASFDRATTNQQTRHRPSNATAPPASSVAEFFLNWEPKMEIFPSVVARIAPPWFLTNRMRMSKTNGSLGHERSVQNMRSPIMMPNKTQRRMDLLAGRIENDMNE